MTNVNVSEMKPKTAFISLLIALLSLTLLTLYPRKNNGSEGKYQADTIVITKTDTIYDTIEVVKYRPKPIMVEVIKKDTITKDTILLRELYTYHDTISTPTDTICVMTEVDGIDVRMNYLKAYLKKGTIHTNTTNTITITKKKGGFHIAPQVGIGYGLINNKADIYVGVGATYIF